MKKVSLYIPKVEDLWFREKCMSDPKTMAYNAGYDVSFDGYHYDTGCIDFPENKHQTWHDEKMTDSNFFFAYIQDDENREWVGYVNFKKNPDTQKASMGIVMNSEYQGKGYMRPAMLELFKKATEKKVTALTDNVPENRERALKVFYDLGFVKTGEEIVKKFGKPELVADIEYVINENIKTK